MGICCEEADDVFTDDGFEDYTWDGGETDWAVI